MIVALPLPPQPASPVDAGRSPPAPLPTLHSTLLLPTTLTLLSTLPSTTTGVCAWADAVGFSRWQSRALCTASPPCPDSPGTKCLVGIVARELWRGALIIGVSLAFGVGVASAAVTMGWT